MICIRYCKDDQIMENAICGSLHVCGENNTHKILIGKPKGNSQIRKLSVYVISGFRREADVIWAPLGYYAAYIGYSVPTFQYNLPVHTSRTF